jgi:hypothetical protein
MPTNFHQTTRCQAPSLRSLITWLEGGGGSSTNFSFLSLHHSTLLLEYPLCFINWN